MGRGSVGKGQPDRGGVAASRLGEANPRDPAPAAELVGEALQQAVLRGLAIWQLFPVLAVLATPGIEHWAAVLTAHLVLMIAFAFCFVRRLSVLPCLIANYAFVALDYTAAADPGSALAFAAVWTAGLTCATPVLVLRKPVGVVMSLAAVLVLTGAQILLRPEWPITARAIVVVCSLILLVGVGAMVRVMRRAADQADAQALLAQQTIHHEGVVLRTGRALAEDARIIHDTVLNTLGAIADGDADRITPRMIRDRCARDAEVLLELTRGEQLDLDFGLEELRRRTGIRIDLLHSSAEDLERLDSLLPVPVSTAIRRAIAEIVANASEHSGADHVTIEVTVREGRIVIEVADPGVGFDGRHLQGRGLAESVFRRCEEAGVEVRLRTAPGQGTAVRLGYLLGDDRSDETVESVAGGPGLDAGEIGRTGYWVGAVAVVLADIALSVVRMPALVPVTFATAAVLGALVLTAWRICRYGRRPPSWLIVSMIVSVPLVFGVSFWATLAHGAPLLDLQALLLFAPLSVLLGAPRSRVPLRLALGGLGLLLAMMSGVLLWTAPELALLPVIAAYPQLGLFAGLLAFHTVLAKVVERHAFERRKTLEAEVGTAAQNALTIARARWILVGARASAMLLTRIAERELDPRDPTVRKRCAEEERYLRQLLSFDVELQHLSPWMALALAQARARRVPLTIRSGTIDAPDAGTARVFGLALLAGIEGCAAEDPLSIGLFSERGEPVCVILGPPAIAASVRHATAVEGWPAEFETSADYALVTLRAGAPMPTPSPANGTAGAEISDAPSG